MIQIILLSIAFIALFLGAVTDIKTREVPDWINYGIIFAGIGIRTLYSSLTSDWTFLFYGLAGLGVFMAISYAMFYAGQWGGGDAKMLMGIGALIGFDFSFKTFSLITLFILIIFAGAVYSLFWSIFLAVKNRKKFIREIKKNIKKYKKIELIISVCSAAILVSALLMYDFNTKIILFCILILINVSCLLALFVKSVEKASMFMYVEPEALTEGDWIAKEYRINNKYICGPKDLGIEKKQIKKLIHLKKTGKIKKILIKVGIPFIPSFLIAFILAIIMEEKIINWIFVLF